MNASAIKARIVDLCASEAHAMRTKDLDAWGAARRERNELEAELTKLGSRERLLVGLRHHARRAGLDVPAEANALEVLALTSGRIEREGGWYGAPRLLQRVDACAMYLTKQEDDAADAILDELDATK